MPKNLKLTIKSLKQSKLTGFSLLEMVITLLIATSLLLIGTLKLKSFQEELLFNSTIKEVATALEEGGRLSVIKRTEVDVACFPSGGSPFMVIMCKKISALTRELRSII